MPTAKETHTPHTVTDCLPVFLLLYPLITRDWSLICLPHLDETACVCADQRAAVVEQLDLNPNRLRLVDEHTKLRGVRGRPLDSCQQGEAVQKKRQNKASQKCDQVTVDGNERDIAGVRGDEDPAHSTALRPCHVVEIPILDQFTRAKYQLKTNYGRLRVD